MQVHIKKSINSPLFNLGALDSENELNYYDNEMKSMFFAYIFKCLHQLTI